MYNKKLLDLKRFFVEANKVRLKLKAYDYRLIDQSISKIIKTVESTGAKVKGPIPLPTNKKIITVIRSPHRHKDSREQFEMRTHKRILDILNAQTETMNSLTRLNLPKGLSIEIKLI